MPTFIDESGCTGCHRTSLPYFRLAAVWVPTPAAAQGFRQAMQTVRANLGLRADYEFRYSDTGSHPDRCNCLYRAALDHGFRFVVCCINKTPGGWRNAQTADFHYATVMYLATTLRPVYRAAEEAAGRRVAEPVTVDDNGDNKYLKTIDRAFRGMRSGLASDEPLTGRPRFGNSARDDLLQLADMTCGAVGDHIEGRSNRYEQIRAAGLGVDCGRGLGVGYLS